MKTELLSDEDATMATDTIEGTINSYCPYCMQKLGNESTCPNCGKKPLEYLPSSHHIPPNTILKDKYVVGKCLGEGGFGITYLGLDSELNRKVAIKEYFPNAFVHREASIKLDVTCYTGGKTEIFEKGRHQFIEEARVMARLDDVNEIVRVLDYFATNNTAYIIMERLTGKTLRQYLAEQGRIPAKYLLGMMEPMVRAMNIMHGEGIIHRDISPDNIMLLNNGTIKLLDFGCARDTDKDHTMTVMLKHGYAPIEQYTGYNQGPWTDIYALCATLYRCLTEQTPPSALDRVGEHDPIIPIRKISAGLTDDQEQAIMKGLSVKPRDRWQSMAGLYAALYGTVIKDFPWKVDPEKTEILVDGGTETLPLSSAIEGDFSPNGGLDEKDNNDLSLNKSQQNRETGNQLNAKHHKVKIIAAVAVLTVIIVMAVILGKPKNNIEQGLEDNHNGEIQPDNAQTVIDAISEYNLGMSLFESEDYEEALSHFLDAAEAGNVEAMTMVYSCWFNGAPNISVERDDALEWIRKAAEKEDPFAMRIAANYIYAENGEYVAAVEWFKKAAEAGDEISMDSLGDIYMYGNQYGSDLFSKWEGIEIDDREAAKWYTKAADAGYNPSMCKLAECYFYGIGVEKSLEFALEWYRKAADAGNTEAMDAYNRLTGSNIYDTNFISENYKDGLAAYSSGNYQRAAKLYEEAYKSDHDKLGLLGLYGLADWFDQIASEGDSVGVDWLVKVANWLSDSLYSYGDFGETSIDAFGEKAQTLYEKAVQHGNDEAVSGMYELALKFPADSDFFQKWMKLAAEYGSEDAQAFLRW